MSSLTRVIHDRVTVLIRIDTRNVNASRVFGHNAKSNSMCTRIVFLSIFFCKSDINYYCNNNNNNNNNKATGSMPYPSPPAGCVWTMRQSE